MINEKQLKRINEFMKSMEGGAVQPDELREVVDVIFSVIKELKEHYEKHTSSMSSEMYQQHEKMMMTFEDLRSKVKDISKDTKKDEISLKLKDIQNRFIGDLEELKQSIPTLPDLMPINAKLNEIEAKIPTIKDETPEETRDKLEKLKGDERLDRSAIKGLDEEVKRLDKKIDEKPTGKMGGMRKVPIIKRIRLTDKCDGTTKTFALPKDTVDVLGVFSSQFPINYDPWNSDGGDWSLSGNNLVLGDGVSAPATGQTLWALVEVLFY